MYFAMHCSWHAELQCKKTEREADWLRFVLKNWEWIVIGHGLFWKTEILLWLVCISLLLRELRGYLDLFWKLRICAVIGQIFSQKLRIYSNWLWILGKTETRPWLDITLLNVINIVSDALFLAFCTVCKMRFFKEIYSIFHAWNRHFQVFWLMIPPILKMV